MLSDKRISLIGSGTMGRTIAGGLLRTAKVTTEQLRATAKSRTSAQAAAAELKIPCGTDNAEAAAFANVIVLCVKPKDVGPVLEALAAKGALAHAPLLVSIAAGVTIGSLEAAAGPNVPVIRAMPNTPCAIGKGMTVLSRGAHAGDEHAAIARELFSPLGRVLELDEKHMDTVTGLSASGPAFIYVVIEALADGGVMRGLPRAVATELVAQMTAGAAEMVLVTGRHPASLKDDVTTPAGCTIAGILALEDGRVRSVLARAVETAAKVAGELAK